MTKEPTNAVRDIIALALAKARTSPPEYATASARDIRMADRVLKAMTAEGWKISHARYVR